MTHNISEILTVTWKVLVGILVVSTFIFFIYSIVQNDLESATELRNYCKNEGARFIEERGLLAARCYDIDDEGFVYYWHRDPEGSWYKTR